MSADRIRQLNDQARETFTGCAVMITPGVRALDAMTRCKLLAEVRDYDAFDEGDDPHHEHDFGALVVAGERYFFKLDYYDLSMTAGSEDPADPAKTQRVLTILRADEY